MPALSRLDLASLRQAYLAGALTPAALVDAVLARVAAHADPAIFIHLLPRSEILAYVDRLGGAAPTSLPLYGVPFAIKDNIDLAGVPTTAACPEFSYTPAASAPIVDRLIAAGAIPIGKTNLDQFATGLVGVRSPYGVPRNVYHPDMIPGGSSSGSASAVAAGLVSFALGTDTAGSGRVPAAFQNLVGLKPTRGWFSTRGIVPACRSLDCPSLFALTVDDATAVADIAAGYDPLDPFARPTPSLSSQLSTEPSRATSDTLSSSFRFGVPRPDQLEWFGDAANPPLYAAALAKLEALGGIRIEIDFAPFRDAARLLYDGPWVAERWSALRDFHARHADAIHPVTRKIIEPGARLLAVDAFESSYRLAALRRAADTAWEQIDTLVFPTAATIYTRAQVEADPVTLNSRLGYYTNFANLLDTAALAVPAGFRPDGVPFGLTFFGPAWSDARLARIGIHFQAGRGAPAEPRLTKTVRPASPADLPLAVVGAHLTGQPLNHQLTSRGARLLRTTTTADCYRLHALPGTTPPKPGLVRVALGAGAPIELEIWSLAPAAWAEFVAAIPPPLAIGTLLLADGTTAKGFLAEPAALSGATDITAFGGWRAYLASL